MGTSVVGTAAGTVTSLEDGNRGGLRILLVDDDRTLREGCASVLQLDGLQVATTGRGDEAIDLLKRRRFDIVLVDLYLTPIGGMDILRAALEAHRDTIVIVMTGNPSVASSIEALRAGAWDYLPKPFDVQELVARIHAILRRGTQRPASVGAPSPPPKLQQEGLTVDFASRTVTYGSSMLELTNIEINLLRMFLESPGVVLTREDLVSRVFQRPFHPLDRSLDMYVSRLRRKLHLATPLGNHIKTIRNSGYLFSAAEPNHHQLEVS